MRLTVKPPPTITQEELLRAALAGLESTAHAVETRIHAIQRMLGDRKPMGHAVLDTVLPKVTKHKKGA